ncbi:MAG: FAD-binding oxidoreductase [Cypionkella sp.]|nr:FAD-binding oxidoreductase [Cypionkella sp.]
MNGVALADFQSAIGAAHVLVGEDCAPYRDEWTKHYTANPSIVLRPANTAEVSACLRIAAANHLPIIPTGGRTGITGAIHTDGGVMLSLERMNAIREIRKDARIAIVEAGVVLSRLHEAAEAQGLYFPLWFGARGSAMIGGVLSTNAGGSNVLRYGSTRGLCMGIEVVLADGRILNLMSELHKDNSGYDLKQLFIGAEGTLGVITAAVMKLAPKPRAYATATLALRSLPDALALLNHLQTASGGLVEGFEYMPASYLARVAKIRPDLRAPFAQSYPINILVELGATRAEDCTPLDDGTLPIANLLENALTPMIEDGRVLDAVVAQSEKQRLDMWARREAAGEVMQAVQPSVDTDICLPLDKIEVFLQRIEARLPQIDPNAYSVCVAHLGDGNLHYSLYPARADHALHDALVEAVEDEVAALGGSFSAEHGVGLMKLNTMARRKDSAALDVMRAVKSALDPNGILNPGKVIPPKTH